MVLTLLGGAVFGVFFGTLVISFASSIGATLAFFTSEVLLRKWVREFGKYLVPINEGFEREGLFYLFALRMVPIFSFFAVNLLMGLTTIKARSFYIISQLECFKHSRVRQCWCSVVNDRQFIRHN